MHIRKTTRHWAFAGAVAAMLAASTAGVRAQDATPPAAPAPDATAPAAPAPDATAPAPAPDAAAPMAPAPDAAAPMAPAPDATTPAPAPPMATGSMSSGSMSGSEPTDYSVLSNRYFDYIDLRQAKARGLSDNQIATVVKISKLTGLPFRTVSAAVERGQTFPTLATEYNLKLYQVYDIDKEKQEIADYTALNDTATSFSKNSSSMASGEPMAPMAGGSMTSPEPSAPMAGGPMAGGMATLDIVDTAAAAKNLTTLYKALQVAGLVETLKGSGPFTVFAPDDKAFSKLPAGALDALLADPAKLKTVLTYHVIPASIMASDADAMTAPTSPPTVQGGTLQVTKGRRGRLKINDANVVKADIKASNGVIHIIDKVLTPPDAGASTGTDTTGTGTTGTDTTGTGAAGTAPVPQPTTTPPGTTQPPDNTVTPAPPAGTAAPDGTPPPAVPAPTQ